MCSLAVRDDAVKSALSTEAALKTVNELLSRAAAAQSDIDDIVSELQSECGEETNLE